LIDVRISYTCQKNEAEPKDVVKNWMRQKNTLEYLGLWERLYNPSFKGVEFAPLLAEAAEQNQIAIHQMQKMRQLSF